VGLHGEEPTTNHLSYGHGLLFINYLNCTLRYKYMRGVLMGIDWMRIITTVPNGMCVSLCWTYSEKFRFEVATVTHWRWSHVGNLPATNEADVWIWLVSYSQRLVILFSASKCLTAIHRLPSVLTTCLWTVPHSTSQPTRHTSFPHRIHPFVSWYMTTYEAAGNRH